MTPGTAALAIGLALGAVALVAIAASGVALLVRGTAAGDAIELVAWLFS